MSYAMTIGMGAYDIAIKMGFSLNIGGLSSMTNAVFPAAVVEASYIQRRPQERFHDLRLSYAVGSLESGDDIKTVQSNLGHATSSFTLDVYGHVSQKMRQQSAGWMEAFIQRAVS